MVELIALIAVVVLALVVVASSVRVIQQSTVGVVQRLGRYQRTLGPGVHLLVPMLDRVSATVDMKETVQAFPPQPVITQDNVTIGIDTVVYYQVTDAVKSTYEVANVLQAMEQLTVTTLRNVVGSLTLEATLTSRDEINSQLRIVLDEATEKWGVRVTRVELKSIDPPRTIQEAMEQQMRADRAKRAAVLQAEGEKQAAILRAEGLRQAAILNAEADQKANVLRAEGEKEARALRADGEAQALGKIFEMVRSSGIAPADMLGYKYLEALPAVADGDANKLLLLPTGAADAMGAVAGLGAAFAEGMAPPRERGDRRPPPRAPDRDAGA
ncbi:MAG TPA: SPFH domain-containing protein [Gaiellales bacterium]|jgi:regulator of protease activity HflC (stomatin/prohibitin superfamily)|nr:SPFH domain-containing protein [Gaiellales bacterium]